MYCPNCGCTNDDDAKVCNNCGGSLKKKSSAPPLSSKKTAIIILVVILVFVSIIAAGTIAKMVHKKSINNYVSYSENTEITENYSDTAKENTTTNNDVLTTEKEITTAKNETVNKKTTTAQKKNTEETKKSATAKKSTANSKKVNKTKKSNTKKGKATTEKSKQTQYRYRDKKFTTSSSKQMSGWTLYNTTTEWSDYGSWSNWSTNSVSSSNSRQSESRTTYRFCVFRCTNCGNRDPYSTPCDNCKTSKYFKWEEIWYPTKGNDMSRHTLSTVPDKYYVTINGQRWWFERDGYSDGQGGIGQPTRTEYRYRDRKQIATYYFYKWGSWSDWSTKPVESSDTREVETRY